MYWDAGTPIGRQVLQKTSSTNAVNVSSPCHPQMDMFSESRAASVSKGSLGRSNHRENVPAINVPPSPPKIVSSYTPKVAGGYQTIATPRSQVLDLTRNDNSFHVIAKLIIDRFEDQLKLHADTITITAGDRFHLDRVVPTKKNFVEAVQYRLQNCSDQSTKPIHLVTRQCRALGLHFDGDRNILFAPVGTIIKIDWADGSLHAIVDSVQNARPSGPNDLARQQLLVELREASNLMAESVTPEASRFWRKHVLELQAKLRSLHDKGMEMNGETSRETKNNDIRQNNEKLMASLWENTGYVPPKQEDMESSVSVSMNNSIVESKDPSRQHFEPLPTETQEAALPMVEVVAPADLPGGYQFEAEIDNKHFLASVPAGGVLKGQTFACTMRQMKESDVPVGRWKDGLFDCFRYGCTHPMLLNSLLCPLLALSQVREEWVWM